MSAAVTVNGRAYGLPAGRSLVACLDGVDPAYLEDAFGRGLTPRLAEMAAAGAFALATAQVPSFTNPNNLSIVTGAPPAVHGVPGNHYRAPDGSEVPLTEPSLLRAPSIQAAFHQAGVPVVAVTTKDKLRRLLACGGVPTFSAERAQEQTLDGTGRPVTDLLGRTPPGIYDWDCSHYALELALALADRLEARLVYVSLTDFVQHAEAPGGRMSDAYLRRLDELVGTALDRGFRLGLVADHGMNAKTRPDGAPNVRYLGDELARGGIAGAHVILPITDPYVVHHASLGSACWVHLEPDDLERARALLERLDGVEAVLSGDEAARTFALPRDRIGDLFVLADAETALGGEARRHDLSSLRGPLRSHGGLHERTVPLLLSHRPTPAGAELLAAGASNADVHHLLLNGTQP